MIGKVVSHYKIIERLGSGGMGIVYRAQDLKLERAVALKFLPPDLTRDPEAKRRFIREAKAASTLQHPNICVVHDIDETNDGQMFISMECVQGETLKDKIERGHLKVGEAIDIAIQVAQGLTKAHEDGIVHRDIKPANIIVSAEGVAKIVDFGLAKLFGRTLLTKDGSTLGTAAYMSPEQARGENVDHRSDIWSLGVVLYEMIAGRRPFASQYEQALVYQILNTEPEPLTRVRPETLPGLAEIVGHALAKQSAARYQTMEEFRDDLAAVAEGLKPLKAKPLVDHPEKSIAVLPFINDSPDQENTYFINGVMEEILNKLQKIKALRIISRTSVEPYRERKKTIREIAGELGVNYIVEGSGQKYGNVFRLRAQLIMVEHESHLWGESFQQKITGVEDIFNIQIKIAESIAEELKAVISPEEKRLIEKIPTADLEVYNEYLKARSYWNDFSRESLNKGLEFLNSGVEKNPDWAPLYSALAQVWMGIQQMGFEPTSVTVPEIHRNLSKAMELDLDLPEAHFLRAMIAHLMEWDWAKSEKEFLKALAINPNDSLSRIFYSQLLAILHRNDEALAQGELAFSLDPLNPNMKIWYGATLQAAGDCKTSLSLGEEVVAADPGNIMANNMIEVSAYRCKEYDKVIRALEYNLPFIGEEMFKEIERIYRKSGIVSAYEEVLRHLEKFAESNYIGFLEMAMRYMYVNQPDKAMDWIEKGFEMHDPQMTYIATPLYYDLDPLFGNSRFIAMCEKMNLPLSRSG